LVEEPDGLHEPLPLNQDDEGEIEHERAAGCKRRAAPWRE
jgi:hypothetical protein